MIPIEKVQIPQGSAFDRERATELIDLSIKAMDEYDDWNSKKNIKPDGDIEIGGKKYKRLCTFWSDQKRDQPFGFIVERKVEGDKTEVFVVFRGTRSGTEWLHNLTPNREPFLDNRESSPNIQESQLIEVRTGFLNIYENRTENKESASSESIKDAIIKTFSEISQESPNADVFVTGHSLGAALATIAVRQIRTLKEFQQPQLYTFASPRVGNTNFANSLRDLDHCYRVANTADIVTAIPIPAGLIFNEKWLNELYFPVRQAFRILRKFLDSWDKLSFFDPFANYQHVGESICFTVQNVEPNGNPSIGENHNMLTYRKAL
ncbi:MAG: lipase family protein [Cyanobacteria bacterium J06639_14]